jgi:DNA-binding SARP family transcriptional activator/TPR repeat protein
MAPTLRLFGGISLETERGPVTGRAVHRHRLALLALLALARTRGLPREKVMALLWPERDLVRARGLLNQAVHSLRRELGAEAIVSAGEELRLDHHAVPCDVLEFEQALAAGDLERAVALQVGPFLDGFFLSDAPDFERWVEGERGRLASAGRGAIESLAERATAAGDAARAVAWWKRYVAHDPLDSRAVVHLMRALEASGNRAAAILQAEAHQRRLREELGIEPSGEVAELSERLRFAAPSVATAISAPPARASTAEALATPAIAPATSGPSVAREPASARRTLLRSAVVAAALLLAWAAFTRVGPDASMSAATAPRPDASTSDEIARAVAREFTRRERGERGRLSAAQRTISIPAYEAYLRGSDPALLRSDSGARAGLAHFRRAVELDSGYAAAWAGLARLTLRARGRTTPAASARARVEAEAAARRAIAIDDSLGEAHATVALVLMDRHDLPAAEAALRRAIAFEPDVATHREWLGRLLIWTGRTAEALPEARHALELQPMSPSANAEWARALLANGRCAEALPQLEKLTGLQPPLARVAGLRAQCLARLGKRREAVDAMRAQARSGVPQALGLLAYVLARDGQRDAARAILDSLGARVATDAGSVLPIATAHLGLGDLDAAVPWLERAVDDGSLSALHEHALIIRALFDSLPADPRIARLRARTGLSAP